MLLTSTPDLKSEFPAVAARGIGLSGVPLLCAQEIDVAPVDENVIKGFAQNAHKLGLNNKQAQGILEFYKSTLEGSAKEILDEYKKPIHAVFCCVGGGGLLAGMATYISTAKG